MLLFLYLLVTLHSCGPALAGQGSLEELTGFGPNPGALKAWHYLPRSLEKSAPLVIVLHGCGQNAGEMARLSGWNTLADDYGFAVLYPEQQVSNNPQNCFNWFLPGDMQRDSGEVVSIQQMVSYVADSLSLDEERIYVTGMSAGGAMAAALLSAYPEAFKAGAVLSGVPYGSAQDLNTGLAVMQGKVMKSASEWGELVKRQYLSYKGDYPKLAVFHGTDDPIVSPINASELAKQWGFLHGIDFTEAERELGFAGNEQVERLGFDNEAGEEVLVKYNISGLGHAIAVDPDGEEPAGGAVGNFAKDVDFFSSYWVAEFFNLTD
ncbi:MAG TPA: PHB depolymerase family esterase [Phaeodactylibacter sp.]|nr:PHB depolymerase family esterase [Phaeodactylibacter sp.]